MRITHFMIRFDSSRADRGFTLVEVLIAIILFAIGLLSIASLVTAVIRSNALGKQITTATSLSQQKLEEYTYKGYSSCTTGTTTDPFDTIPNFPGYKRVVTVSSPVSNMKKVTVDVYRKPNELTSSISTIVAK